MTFLGLDEKAWVLLGSFALVLFGGIVLGLSLARTDPRVRAARRENKRLARVLGESHAANAFLRAQLHSAQRRGSGDLTAVLDAVQSPCRNGEVGR